MGLISKSNSNGQLRTIIIDDEAHQRLTIGRMVEHYCTNLRVVAHADGVQAGIEAIRQYNPDLVFLDIQMNDGTGFNLLEQLQPFDFKVIFITAFEQYAGKTFQFTEFDYLLKPVDPDELVQVVEKAQELIRQNLESPFEHLKKTPSPNDNASVKIVIKTRGSLFLIAVGDIFFCEGDSGYTKFHIRNHKPILASTTLDKYEFMLTDYGFFRPHENYLINLQNITGFENDPDTVLLLEGDYRIPVESRKELELLEKIKRMTSNDTHQEKTDH